MTQTDPFFAIEQEAIALAESLFEDRISPEQSVRLEYLVVGHPEIARAYLGYAHLWCALPLHVAPSAIRPETLLDLADHEGERESRSMNDSMMMPAIRSHEEADASIVVPPGEAEAMSIPVPRKSIKPADRKSPRGRWLLAASVLLAAGIAVWRLRSGGAPTAAATLAETVDAQWIGTPVLAGTQVFTGSHVRLASGLARVVFDGGATVILEGPADLQINSRSEAELESGKLTATVPAPARGFAVRTPSARIVDLGTEFGVEAHADGSTHVEVFRGTVEAHALQPSSGPASQTLTANQAADVSANGSSVAAVLPAPAAFTSVQEFSARALAKGGSSYDRWLAYSYTLRRDPSAVLFYTFDRDSEAPEQLTNYAAAGAGRWNIPLDQYRPAWSTGRWDRKGAMSFDAAKLQHLLLDEFPAAPNNKLTVSAWVFARSRPTWGTIASNWTDALHGQFRLGLFHTRGDMEGEVGLADGSYLSIQEPGPVLFPIGQWEQVACVIDSSTLQLFRDGRMVASAPCPGLVTEPKARSLAIGYRSGGSAAGYWDGKIDELAVFHRAFSADEIHGMYEAGKP